MRSKAGLLILPVLLMSCSLCGTTYAQFSPLFKCLPSSTNTIILINADKIFNSEVALREGWRENFEKAVKAGLTRLPPDTRQYVLASQMDFEFMQPVWQIGALKTKDTHDLAAIARVKKGTLDTLVGRKAALMPTGNYVVEMDPHTFAAIAPAGRQAVANWIREVDKGAAVFTPYIQEAMGYAEEVGTEIIMAMDLRDVLDPALVKERLKESEAAAKYKLDVEKVGQLFAGVRGVTLGITLGKKPFGKIKVDFRQDASVLADAVRPLFLEVLKRQGAMIDDFETWEAGVKGNQVSLQGYFSASGMRHVFSLVDAPVAEAVAAEKPAQSSVSDNDTPAVASQRYFKAVVDVLDDIRHHESPQRIAQYGLWFDKYARKIDRLPMVNVDDDALNYGEYVAQQLRNAATAIQGIGIRSRVRQVNAVDSAGAPGYYGSAYDGGYHYGGFYYRGGAGSGFARANYMQAGLRQQQQIRTQVKVQEKATGVSAARAIMKDVENATSQVRRQLTKKYNIEF